MTTGTPGDSATLGGELCPDIYQLCRLGQAPRLTGLDVAGGGDKGSKSEIQSV